MYEYVHKSVCTFICKGIWNFNCGNFKINVGIIITFPLYKKKHPTKSIDIWILGILGEGFSGLFFKLFISEHCEWG